MITLHHLNRSRSHRILWLLEEIGEPYKVAAYQRDPKTNLAPPELALVHPLGKSPMIEIDGELVVESAAIVEVLCERFAPQMIPERGTPAYLRHLEAMHFAEGSAMTPILLNLYVSNLGDAGKPLHPRITSELDRHYRYMNDMLRPSGHFVQDSLSAADIMLSFPAEIAMRQERGDDYPALAGFVEMIQGREAYQRATQKGRSAQGDN
ncbi:glutathione S-transferase family protein [Sulfitobacter aestuariivivens]|uniref:Glutathione S-transferase n=1 Tax=Sulfitobacter aestuariivivens TaxID=2766981 RepID=A0A927D5X6_9RHOB|nr:glutathione S-transferase [Sulfitobacter aestuariivivens]MBD3664067.1 glutathione S-transferase [Sulfitobacter aestuariivivens]